jgi:hypothetical protein
VRLLGGGVPEQAKAPIDVAAGVGNRGESLGGKKIRRLAGSAQQIQPGAQQPRGGPMAESPTGSDRRDTAFRLKAEATHEVLKPVRDTSHKK